MCVCALKILHTAYDDSLSLLFRYLVDSSIPISCAVIGPKNNELPSDWTVKNFDL